MRSSIITFVLGFAGQALAAPLEARSTGEAIIYNSCNFTVWAWSVGVKVSATHEIQPGQVYKEQYHNALNGAGMSLKVSRQNNLYESADDILQFEYCPTGDLVYYDLSLINGNPFKDYSPQITSSDLSCTVVTQSNAYHEPNDIATQACSVGADLTLNTC